MLGFCLICYQSIDGVFIHKGNVFFSCLYWFFYFVDFSVIVEEVIIDLCCVVLVCVCVEL